MKTLRVKTDVFERGVIDQEVLEEYCGIAESIARRIVDTEDQEIRKALIELGWTPPAEGENL